jgi:hypothetical protein
MPGLAIAKRRTGNALANRTLIADSAETAFCAFTFAAALTGLGLNSRFASTVGRSHFLWLRQSLRKSADFL